MPTCGSHDGSPPDDAPSPLRADGHVRLSHRGRLFFWILVFEGGLGGLAILIGLLAGPQPLEALAWRGRDAALGLAATTPLVALFVITSRYPAGPLRRIWRFFRNVLRPLLAGAGTLRLLLISASAGVGEEFLFRGVIQQAWGLVPASVLFGLGHWITPTYALLAAAMGAYFGWLFQATGNLLVPVIAHAAYDFVALLLLVRERTKGDGEQGFRG